MTPSLSAKSVEALESRILGTLREFVRCSLSVRHQAPILGTFKALFKNLEIPCVPLRIN